MLHRFQHLDAFGKRVNFYYKGEGQFSTGYGCLITLVVAMAYLIMVSLKLTEFLLKTDSIETSTSMRQDLDDSIILSKIGFSFAIPRIDERIGYFQVDQVNWSSRDGQKRKRPIELVECNMLMP